MIYVGCVSSWILKWQEKALYFLIRTLTSSDELLAGGLGIDGPSSSLVRGRFINCRLFVDSELCLVLSFLFLFVMTPVLLRSMLGDDLILLRSFLGLNLMPDAWDVPLAILSIGLIPEVFTTFETGDCPPLEPSTRLKYNWQKSNILYEWNWINCILREWEDLLCYIMKRQSFICF